MPAHVHLPEPVLGLHESLRKEEVVAGRRPNGRDAEVVASDLDLCVQTCHREVAVDLRKGALHEPSRCHRACDHQQS